jgi:hypothetical protein
MPDESGHVWVITTDERHAIYNLEELNSCPSIMIPYVENGFSLPARVTSRRSR